MFIILKYLNHHSSIININPSHFLLYKLFYNFKTFKLSLKYPKQKSYLLFLQIILQF
jgi:hypothetical protein